MVRFGPCWVGAKPAHLRNFSILQSLGSFFVAKPKARGGASGNRHMRVHIPGKPAIRTALPMPLALNQGSYRRQHSAHADGETAPSGRISHW
jgi:hypothetical protein